MSEQPSKTWHGLEFSLEPQSIASDTKEGSRVAANRWVEYVQSAIDGTSGKAANQLNVLQERIAELEREIEVMNDPAVTEQNREEIRETQDEIRMRQYAKQQGIDFDATHRSRMEALQLLGGNIAESFTAQRGPVLSDLDHEPQAEEKLLSYWRDQYLLLKKAEIETGKRGVGRFDNLQREVKRFVAFIGDNATVDRITEASCEAYYLEVIKKMQRKRK